MDVWTVIEVDLSRSRDLQTKQTMPAMMIRPPMVAPTEMPTSTAVDMQLDLATEVEVTVVVTVVSTVVSLAGSLATGTSGKMLATGRLILK